MSENIRLQNNPCTERRVLSRQTWISAAFFLIFVSLISKFLGFIREILIAKNFGVSIQVDAYMVAVSVPVLIGGVLGSAFGTALIPFYQKILNKKGPEEASKLNNSLFLFIGIISLFFMILISLSPDFVISIIAPSLPQPTSILAIELLKWLALLTLGNSFFNLLSSVYNAFHHFKIPAFTDLLSNLWIIIALVMFSSIYGIYALLIGLIGGVYLVVLLLTINSLRMRIIGFHPHLKAKEFKELIRFTIPILLYIFLPQLISIVENYFGASLKEGSISALGYAKRLFDAISTIIAVNIAKATFPTFSQLSFENKIGELRDIVVKLNQQIIIYLLPLSVALIFFNKKIIQFVFMRGAFDALAVKMTSDAFIFYAGILIVNMLLPTFFRLCYAFSDNITPIRASSLAISCSLPLYFFLTPKFGISGIALSSCLSALMTLFLTGLKVRKKIGGLDLRKMFRSLGKSFFCSIIALIPFMAFETKSMYTFLFAFAAYFFIYFMLGWFVLDQEIRRVWVSFRRLVQFRLCL